MRAFLTEKVAPHAETWEREGLVPQEPVRRVRRRSGVTGLQVPEEYGGGGEASFAYQAILTEEIVATGAATGALLLHLNVVLPYFLAYGTPGQLARWCPGFVSGTLVTAIAMTEPGTGSDLAGITATAVRDGDHYVAGRRQDVHHRGRAGRPGRRGGPHLPRRADRRGGLTLLVVESGMPGFSRGRKLEKLGLRSQDTGELFFDGVRVPVANRLGEEGEGVRLPRRRTCRRSGWRSRSAPRPPASGPSR